MHLFNKFGLCLRRIFSHSTNNVKTVQIKYWWVIVLSAVLHRLPFSMLPRDSFIDLKKACMILSYVFLFWALIPNLKFRSFRALTVGTLLNFIAIVANGGLMPVSPEARALAHMTALGPSQYGMILPEGSGIFLPLEQTNTWFLTDIIPVHYLGGVFSVGDVLIGLGFVIFLLEIAFRKNVSTHGDVVYCMPDNGSIVPGNTPLHPFEYD